MSEPGCVTVVRVALTVTAAAIALVAAFIGLLLFPWCTSACEDEGSVAITAAAAAAVALAAAGGVLGLIRVFRGSLCLIAGAALIVFYILFLA